MKTIIALCALVAVACAAPNYSYSLPEVKTTSYSVPELPANVPVSLRKVMIPIIRYIMDNDNLGNYDFTFETGDGTVVVENGHLKDLRLPEGPVNVKAGSYSFVAKDGKRYTVNWTADETGFHATGDHLPTPPPIPEEILKSLSAAPADMSGAPGAPGAGSFVSLTPTVKASYDYAPLAFRNVAY